MSSNMLGDFVLGAEMLGADPDIVAVDAGTATVHAETRVSGSMGYTVEALLGSVVAGSTVVTGSLRDAYGLSVDTVVASTVVTASAPTISNLRGSMSASTSLSGANLRLIPAALRAAVSARTTVHGALQLAMVLTGSASCRTVVTANLTKPVNLSGGSASCSTVVVADVTRHILRGQLTTGTAVTGRLILQGRFSPTPIAARTIVHGTAILGSANTGSVTGATVVTSRIHVYPEDFQDLKISMHTIVGGILNVAAVPSVSTIVGRTTVTAAIRNKLFFLARTIAGSTVVRGMARHGFGADIILRSKIRAALGIKTGINSFSGRTIHCRTTIVAFPPENRFRGTAVCGTTLAVPTITIGYAVIGNVICSTVFYSHFGGRHPTDGPFGSVVLTSVPRGDMGIPAEIDGGTTLTANVTVERHRMMVIFGNAGVSVDRTLVVNGTAIAGTGTQNVGVPIDFLGKIERAQAFYV